MNRFMAAALLSAMAGPLAAQVKSPEQLYQDVSRSIVTIQVLDREGGVANLGSGVVTAAETVVTNCHVLEGGVHFSVVSGRTTHTGTLRVADHDRDLCELQVSTLNAPRVTLFTGRLRVGQRVYAVGAPEGLELTISEGLVSSIRELDGAHYIQTSAPISSGSSGGGLFDAEGRLVGLTAFIIPEGQNLNFALPASWITELAARSGSKPTLANRDAVNEKWQARSAELRAKKDWTGLLAVTQQWVRVAPAAVPGWIALGEAYRLVNRPRRAIVAYNQALKLDGDSYEAWLGAGVTYLALNQYDRAVEASQEALRLRANDLPALVQLGTAYHHQNQRARVREVHARIEKLDGRAARDFAGKFITN
ncbi:MAG: trypsin-like peptidase domain-containing protein [Burkholderiales bacterium]|nr:trypsin-like peptidase domain-containing protein [Burkholderiales bacterium]